MKHQGRLLVIDDDSEMRELMRDYLTAEGYQVEAFGLGQTAFEYLQNEVHNNSAHLESLDLVISDIQMPGMDGLELVERVKHLRPELPVILVTAFGSIESALEATRKGAFDYIVKPFKLSELLVRVQRAQQVHRIKREHQSLREEMKKGWTHYDMIGKSKAMRSVFEMIDRVAGATANVLITGESGVGKEVVARAIHEQGPRASKPFVAINCTAIPESLLESELFGHAKGSFTGAIARKKGLFEEAQGGTLFLDEIGDMDMALQVKLLRVLQERRIRSVGDTEYREIDVRIISATHKDLLQAVKENLFREDLFYRLSVIPISIPPLRHRKEDIPLLAQHFLSKYSAANGARVRGLTSAALERLVNSPWPGNVRELENLIERMVVLAKTEVIDESDLPLPEATSAEDFYGAAKADLPSIEALERRYMQYVLEKVGGRKEKAAQILGINRRTLYRKEREYGFVSDTDSEFSGHDEAELAHDPARDLVPSGASPAPVH